jgi:hypothetical protein
MKNFSGISVLVFLLAGCGDPGSADGLPPAVPGMVGGADVMYVGGIASPFLPADGTCRVPSIALEGFTPPDGIGGFTPPKVLEYVVATGDILWCGVRRIDGSFDNLDFSQPPLGGLTCQELAADTPAAVEAASSPCCEGVSAAGDSGGYVQTAGLSCGFARPDTFKVLCSISGVFMGWACYI